MSLSSTRADVTRRITIVAQVQGSEAAAAALKNLGKEFEATATTYDKASASVQRSTDRALNTDPLRKAVTQLTKLQSDLARGVAQGATTPEAAASAIAMQEQAVIRLASAQDALGHSANSNVASTQALFHSVRSIGEQMALGISPVQALTGQLSHLSFVMTQPGGLSGALGGLGGTLRGALGFINPVTLGIGALAAAAVASGAALLQYNEAQKQVALSLTGLGRASGATVSDMNAIAEAGARAGNLSVGSARDMAMALAQTGVIGKASFEGIIAVARDYAKITGQDLADAQKELAHAFADPAKGIDILGGKLGALSASNREYIESVARSGNAEGARKALLGAVNNVLDDMNGKLKDGIGFWERLKNIALRDVNDLGKMASNAVTGPTGQDKINALMVQRRQAELLPALDPAMKRQAIADLDALIDKEMLQIRVAKDMAETQAEAARIVEVSNKAKTIVDGVMSEVQAYKTLTEQINTLSQALKNKDSLDNPIATQQALANLTSQRAALNPVPGNPDANRAALMAQDYENQIRSIQAITVEQKAAAAAQIAYTAALREGKGETIANVASENARGQALAQSVVEMQKSVQAARDQLELLKMQPQAGEVVSPNRAADIAERKAEMELQRQGIDLSSKEAREKVALEGDIARETAARELNAAQYQAAISGSKTYTQVLQDERNGLSHLTQAQLDNIKAMDLRNRNLQAGADAAARFNAMLAEGVRQMENLSSTAAFLPDITFELEKMGVMLSKDIFSMKPGQGVPMNSGSMSYSPNAFRDAELQKVMAQLGKSSSSTSNNVASIGSSLQSLMQSLGNVNGSGSGSGGVANDNGNKQMPQLNAYGERSASVYYGTETGNYYVDGIQKSVDVQGQILDTNQAQLASQTEAQAALTSIMNAANQMVQQNMTPQQVYGFVIQQLQAIGYNKTAADMQAQLDAMLKQQASAFNSMQAGMLQKQIGMLSGGVGGVYDPNYVKPGTWASNPFAPALTDTFTGYHAKGGYIPSGSWGIAGEAGPEVITGPSTVIPIDKLGGRSSNERPITVIQNITQHITTNDGQRLMKGLTSQATQNVLTRSVIGGANAA